MVKVSVLMPVYNTKEEYLREAIESVLGQTFDDFEFIIINDGSTDKNVEKVVLSYNDDRIKYFYQENMGLPKTRNRLMDLAKGEYLALCDHDDISTPTRFEEEVRILDKNPNIGLVSSSFKFFPKKQIIKRGGFVRPMDFLMTCAVAQPCAMLRKSVFDENHLRYDEKFFPAEDYEMYTRAIFVTEMFNLPEVLLNYRWHDNNLSVTANDKQIKNTIIARYNLLNRLFPDKKQRMEIILKYSEPVKRKWYEWIFSSKNRTFINGEKQKEICILGLIFRRDL